MRQAGSRPARRRPARGTAWRFTGRVSYVGGSEAARLRAELAAVTRDLLAWARRQDGGAGGAGRDEDGRAA
jgi:hypothetical protein